MTDLSIVAKSLRYITFVSILSQLILMNRIITLCHSMTGTFVKSIFMSAVNIIYIIVRLYGM